MGMKLWWQSASLAPRRCGFDSHRLHQASVVSTASTRPLYGRSAGSTPAGGSLASLTGVGLRPPPRAAEPPPTSGPCAAALFRSHTGTQRRVRKPRGCFARRAVSSARSSVESAVLIRQRRLVRLQPGGFHADVAQPAEHRSATPGRPVRFGSSACSKRLQQTEVRGVTGSTASSNFAGPGSNPGGPVVAGRSGPVIG